MTVISNYCRVITFEKIKKLESGRKLGKTRP